MTDQHYFPYDDSDLTYLSERDPALGEAIHQIGRINRTVISDPFAALVNSIVGQQISTKAQETVWARLLTLTDGKISPLRILHADEDALRSCGLSGRKVKYLYSAAHSVSDGTLDMSALSEQPDDQVIDALTVLPGVGRWTAEMLLIFSYCRKNVLSVRDFGIRRGASILYHVPQPDDAFFDELRQRYAPLCSVASLYLWEISARNRSI